MTSESTMAALEAENAMLREQLAWCMPRLSREKYRTALIAFLAQRGIIMVPPARDVRRLANA